MRLDIKVTDKIETIADSRFPNLIATCVKKSKGIQEDHKDRVVAVSDIDLPEMEEPLVLYWIALSSAESERIYSVNNSDLPSWNPDNEPARVTKEALNLGILPNLTKFNILSNDGIIQSSLGMFMELGGHTNSSDALYFVSPNALLTVPGGVSGITFSQEGVKLSLDNNLIGLSYVCSGGDANAEFCVVRKNDRVFRTISEDLVPELADVSRLFELRTVFAVDPITQLFEEVTISDKGVPSESVLPGPIVDHFGQIVGIASLQDIGGFRAIRYIDRSSLQRSAENLKLP